MDTVIKVENVSKKFSKDLNALMVNGIIDVSKDFFGVLSNTEQLRKGEFWAVDGISFELKKGESLALIGKNGSGKSTLLKMINGIYMPDKGRISVNGRVGALIEVGAGFHPMLTGRENIYVNGAILGMSKKEINKKFDSIVDFAEIGEFIDAPVKHYSSGMYVRLGFSIAVHCNPEIILVDEVLSVGDYNFQLKCLNKIKELKDNGTSFILVSHSETAIRSICQNGVVINKGIKIYENNIDQAMQCYQKILNEDLKIEKDISKANYSVYTSERRGTGKARILEVKIMDVENNPVDKIPFGTEKIKIIANYIAYERIEKPRFMAKLRDPSRNEHIFALGVSTLKYYEIESIEGEGEFEFEIDVSNLGPKLYGLNIGIADSTMLQVAYDYWDINNIYLEVEPSDKIKINDLIINTPSIIPEFKFSHKKLK